jgi:hypothetical protein
MIQNKNKINIINFGLFSFLSPFFFTFFYLHFAIAEQQQSKSMQLMQKSTLLLHFVMQNMFQQRSVRLSPWNLFIK